MVRHIDCAALYACNPNVSVADFFETLRGAVQLEEMNSSSVHCFRTTTTNIMGDIGGSSDSLFSERYPHCLVMEGTSGTEEISALEDFP